MVEYKYNGSSRVGFFAPVKVGEETWWSRTMVTGSDFNGTAKRTVIAVVTVSLISIIILILFIIKNVGKKIKPIEDVNIALGKLREGDLNARLETEEGRIDELRILKPDRKSTRLNSSH